MFMHGLIREGVEDYLRGGKTSPEFLAHLRNCETCRELLNSIQEQSQMLRVLAPSRVTEPAPGFYARILERIETREGESFWTVFTDPWFVRRVLATSLTLAVLLGGYLAFMEAGQQPVPAAANAERIIAVDEHPPGLGEDRQRDRNTMLVTLASYRE